MPENQNDPKKQQPQKPGQQPKQPQPEKPEQPMKRDDIGDDKGAGGKKDDEDVEEEGEPTGRHPRGGDQTP